MDAGASTSARRVVWLIAVLAVLTQSLSATFLVKEFTTPNAATDIARHLVDTGEMRTENFWTRLRGPYPPPTEPLRMFHLPGEPLYLAAGFKLLPTATDRYLHVPVTVLLIVAACAAAVRVAGTRAGLIVGLLACLNPYTLLHGPVWDDLFLGAALEWTVFLAALNALRLQNKARDAAAEAADRPARIRGSRRGVWSLAVIAGAAAAMATLTRSQSMLTLGGFAALVVLLPRLRPAWPVAVLVVVGVTLAAGGWGLRNRVVMGHFTIGSSHDGITLYESNYPHAVEAVRDTGQVERLNAKYMADDYDRTRDLGEFEADAYFRRRATDSMKANPLGVLAAVPIKAWVTLTGWDFAMPAKSPRNLVSLATNAILLLLATAGVATTLRRWQWRNPAHQLLLAVALTGGGAVILLLVIGPVGLRYRMTIEPLVWLSASVFVRDRLGPASRPTRPQPQN